jgi:hypothetical protein
VATPFVLAGALMVLPRLAPHLDVFYRDAYFHLLVVSAIALCALIVAVVATRGAARAAHYGPVWLAVGCLAVGILMVGHGLTTPGVAGRPVNTWVGRLPYIAIAWFAVALALAARPRNTATSRIAALHPRWVLGIAGAVLAGAGTWVVVDPTRLAGTQALPHEDLAKWVMSAACCGLLAVVTTTHWRRWRLGHDPVQYALALAGVLSAGALVSLRTGEMWRLSWWDYHGFLLAGFGGAVYAVAVRYRRTQALEQVMAATFDSDPMAHIVDGYPEALKTLIRAVEVKDRYTHGHSERTAKVAVQLATRLNLNSDALRALARGAYLHDVGKIAIPDSILNKPAGLSVAEREVIETHPAIGHELVAPVPALAEAVPVVLHHHERWDGTGYPDGLAGSTIPLIARIAAIADVWDALTSDRSYRPGLPPQVALAHIEAGRGTHFDPRLVDAMLALAADWGYRTASVAGDADEACDAAESCHEVVATRA